jgi:hypothetical protein
VLKKFNQNGKKIEDRVKYPFELDIKKYKYHKIDFVVDIMDILNTCYNQLLFIKAHEVQKAIITAIQKE